jgi:hypothetical protein
MTVRSINTPGWDGLNATVADSKKTKITKEQKEIDLACARAFKTVDGKKFLNYLKSKTLDQPAWVPGVDASFGYAREGQNSIVREILNRIERAENE